MEGEKSFDKTVLNTTLGKAIIAALVFNNAFCCEKGLNGYEVAKFVYGTEKGRKEGQRRLKTPPVKLYGVLKKLEAEGFITRKEVTEKDRKEIKNYLNLKKYVDWLLNMYCKGICFSEEEKIKITETFKIIDWNGLLEFFLGSKKPWLEPNFLDSKPETEKTKTLSLVDEFMVEGVLDILDEKISDFHTMFLLFIKLILLTEKILGTKVYKKILLKKTVGEDAQKFVFPLLDLDKEIKSKLLNCKLNRQTEGFINYTIGLINLQKKILQGNI